LKEGLVPWIESGNAAPMWQKGHFRAKYGQCYVATTPHSTLSLIQRSSYFYSAWIPNRIAKFTMTTLRLSALLLAFTFCVAGATETPNITSGSGSVKHQVGLH